MYLLPSLQPSMRVLRANARTGLDRDEICT